MIALMTSTPLHAQRDTLSTSAIYTRGLILEQIDGEVDQARRLYTRVASDPTPDVVEAVDAARRKVIDPEEGWATADQDAWQRFSIVTRARVAAHRRRTGVRHISAVPTSISSSRWIDQLKTLLGFGRYVRMGRDPEAFGLRIGRHRNRLADDYQAAMIRHKAMDDAVSASRRYRSITESYAVADERVVRSSELIEMVRHH